MAFQSNAFQVNAFQDSGGAPIPVVVTRPTGAGRRRSQRFVARFKDEDYHFRTAEELEAFVAEAQKSFQTETKAERRRAKTQLRVTVEPEFQAELYAMDLPSLQPMIDRGRFDEVARIMARFEMNRMEAKRSQWRKWRDEEDVLLLL